MLLSTKTSINQFHRILQIQMEPEKTVLFHFRPSTPISELMEYKYAQRWLEEQQAKDRALQAHQHKKVCGGSDKITLILTFA